MAELPRHVCKDDAAVLMLDHQTGLSSLTGDFGLGPFKYDVTVLAATANHFRRSTFVVTRKNFTLSLLLTMLLLFSGLPTSAAEPWEVLPPTPAPIPSERSGQAAANGVIIHYAVYGQGSPVILLHGGLANTDYWGNQIHALAPHHTVIVMDSRGHGRSTRDSRPYGYDLMADDVVALMDVLKVPKADIVGWSDGAILGLDLAMRYPDRVEKIFAFAANTMTSGVIDGVDKNPTFAAFIERAGQEYKAHSATPTEYDAFVAQIGKMWASQPNWTDVQLKAITAQVLVVDGDHDEAIKRAHTEYIAATISGAGLLILPNASHFAFLQDPGLFNYAILHFLGDQ
jgi:pimeloyl-ACP methyl ester carboxylesterase